MNNKIFIVEDYISICDMVENYLISEVFSKDTCKILIHGKVQDCRKKNTGQSAVNQ
ncbi:MAG: hypothetical protein K2K21_06430 [Lachnospiraceae bacterium]|nr:hypothetical protein [Lachnospiraceae bacterium]